jgi:hypothetical protein
MNGMDLVPTQADCCEGGPTGGALRLMLILLQSFLACYATIGCYHTANAVDRLSLRSDR